MTTVRSQHLAVVLLIVASALVARADSVGGYSSTGSIVIEPYEWGGVPAAHGPVALLSEFSFEYVTSDHHVRRISLNGVPSSDYWTEPRLYIDFENKSGREPMWFDVRHIDVAGWGENYWKSGYCTGYCNIYIGDTRTSSSHVFVLSDFTFDFGRGEDHHLDEIAILQNGDYLYLAFNNKSDDQEFYYHLNYVWLAPEAYEYSDNAWGNLARDWTPVYRPDLTAIRGFRLDFDSSCTGQRDRQIKKIEIDRTSITYRDLDGDDCYYWELRWIKLDESQVRY